MFIALYFDCLLDLCKIPWLGFQFECSAKTKFFENTTFSKILTSWKYRHVQTIHCFLVQALSKIIKGELFYLYSYNIKPLQWLIRKEYVIRKSEQHKIITNLLVKGWGKNQGKANQNYMLFSLYIFSFLSFVYTYMLAIGKYYLRLHVVKQ